MAPPPNTYGDSGRGVLYAPGIKTFDMSLSRRFPIKAASTVQFRADAFNLFNTPQFGFPNQNIGSPTAGRITTLQPDIGNRQLQFALKLDFYGDDRSVADRSSSFPSCYRSASTTTERAGSATSSAPPFNTARCTPPD